jgi:glycolate oxidase iron-sulfur subunit
MSLPPRPAPLRHPLQDTDRCVMCGLCLPHCPTYLKTQDEGESPRGRIALMQGLAAGSLPLGPRMEAHLEHCLGCRACEAVCPSGVPYGRLLDAARAELVRAGSRPRRAALLGAVLERPRALRAIAALLALYRGFGVQWLARRTGALRLLGLEPLDRLLAAAPAVGRLRSYYPPAGAERAQAALFSGCISQTMEQGALRAAIRVLNRLGIGVHVPPEQVCCGALHLHGGAPEAAGALARRNIAAFAASGAEPVVFTASACGAQLHDYSGLSVDAEPARRFAERVQDLAAYLNACHWPREVSIEPLQARVAVHEPCTQRNVLHSAPATYALLGRIPELELAPLPGNERCCGGAGTYMVEQPAMAHALLADKLGPLADARPDILVTSNVGCALHFRAGLHEAGLRIEVLHPIELLDRQMRGAPAELD